MALIGAIYSLNNILFTNPKLIKIGLLESEKCSFCTIYKEDLYHLFYDCSYVRTFWKRFCNWWSNLLSENLSSSLKDIIVGILNRKDILNYLIILGKLCIWDRRRNKSFQKFNQFLHKVEAKRETGGSLPQEIRNFKTLGKDGKHYHNIFFIFYIFFNYLFIYLFIFLFYLFIFDTARREYVVGSFKIGTTFFFLTNLSSEM